MPIFARVSSRPAIEGLSSFGAVEEALNRRAAESVLAETVPFS